MIASAKFTVVIPLVLAATLAGCGRHNSDDGATVGAVASGDVDVSMPYLRQQHADPQAQRLVRGYNEFGFRLLRQMAEPAQNQNVLISPLSLAMVLAMTNNGATGNTRQEISQVLGISQLAPAATNAANARLRQDLHDAGSSVELHLANSLWIRQRFPVRPQFLKTTQQNFAATATNLNFDDPHAAATINAWVRRNTDGKIQQLVGDNIDPMVVMCLVNATYFKGQWQAVFDKSMTHDDNFMLQSGEVRQVSFMHQKGKYQYLHEPTFQALNLPYKSAGGDPYEVGRMSLYVILPDKGTSVDDLIKLLNQQTWQTWMEHFGSSEGDVTLPRFKLDYGSTLNTPLRELGIKAAFDSHHADFAAMSPVKPLWLSEVKQQASIQVDEAGTTAAAGSMAGVAAGNEATPQPFSFVADHPFLAVLQDNETGSILFLSAVMEPQA